MKLFGLTLPTPTREVRVAILIALLIALGVLFLDAGWRGAGLTALLLATAIAVAFYALVIRPARVPREAVLTIRLAGGIHEDAPRNPIEQLRSHGTPTLFDIRNALEAAAEDPRLQTVLVEIFAPALGLATAHE